MVVENQKALEAYKLIWGPTIDLTSFDSRLLFQKTIYLLKNIGVDFSELKFRWFHRGPFCFEIAGMYFKEKKGVGNKLTTVEKKEISGKIPIIRKLLEDTKTAELNASVVFLLVDEKLSPEKTVEKMSLLKPWFTEEQVNKAILEMESVLHAIPA